MSKTQIQHLHYRDNRLWHGLVVGRAGLDLYPQPSGSKTRDADLFTSDVGGSGANIAVAMRRAGGKVGLISALSDDPVGEYVRQQLTNEGIDLKLLQTQLSKLTSKGRLLIANSSGHHIHLEQPELILTAVMSILEKK